FREVSDKRLQAIGGNGDGFHAMRSIKLVFVASGKTKSSVRAPRKSRKLMSAPTRNERAPSSPWAVAASAALLDQTVQAPRPICAGIIAAQIIDQSLVARARRLTFHENARTTMAMKSPSPRWAI